MHCRIVSTLSVERVEHELENSTQSKRFRNADRPILARSLQTDDYEEHRDGIFGAF
jgi:hypothetical protein